MSDSPFNDALADLEPPDRGSLTEAALRQKTLTKPPGSLGQLEDLANRLAGMSRSVPAPVPASPLVGVFAGDHGVVAEGVTAWPQEVTAQMVANFLAGGAAINTIARQVGATVVVVDAGVATDLDPHPQLVDGKVRRGTSNLAREAAMSEEDVRAALELGARVALEATGDGADLLVTGDMGIGNTTPSAAVIAALCGRDPADVVGRGTGIDNATLAVKTRAVRAGLERLGAQQAPISVLSEVGGLEIAALAGFIVAGASARVPVVLDGVISLAAAVAATAIQDDVRDYLVAGHRSVEPGATVALDHLGLRPLIDLDMRLGEGTGGCLAIPIVQAAARHVAEMATFASAAVTDRTDA